MRSPATLRKLTDPSSPEPSVRPRRRPGRAAAVLGATPLAVSLAFSVAFAPTPAAAAPAAPPDSTGEAVESTAAAIGGLIGHLLAELDEMGAFKNGGAQAVASDGTTTQVKLTQAWVAPVGRLGPDDRPVRTASACAWRIRSNLRATYDRTGGHALQEVTGQPDAALRCSGSFGLPVRQVGTLTHRLNGTTDATIGVRRCAATEGCADATVTGPYRCSGAGCAGTHQLVLRHTWTLPAPYVWVDAPDRCRVRDRGQTLSCTTMTRRVTIPANRGGISITQSGQAT